ncbi:hypothetical protein [Actinomadura sp. 3N508]|uniref:hypothetical protein n=1 Tax=Actinomadura sp. 3N508 TaxID=3375153 RepID=UPI0037A77D39
MIDRRQLYQRLWQGPMFQRWHWLEWNFAPGRQTPFAQITLDALVRCDAVMPGYAEAMVTTLEAIGGREHDRDDLERLKQWLGELHVVHHFVTWAWPEQVTFKREPTAGGSLANPEITITAADWRLGVEVKTPDLRKLSDGRRSTNPFQVLARVDGGPTMLPGPVTMPRDNPIKDFLVSANRKFTGFHATDPGFYGILVIVWDDFVNEPISALLSPASGLFTPNSFHTDRNGSPHTYPCVDAVVLLRQQHQFIEGMANRPPLDERRHFLDYGDLDRFPPNAVIPNPHSTHPVSDSLVGALQAWYPQPTMGGEYVPAELVIWT